jgi:hypothetical protein
MGVSVKNPGISTALAVVAATVVGGALYLWARRRPAAAVGETAAGSDR